MIRFLCKCGQFTDVDEYYFNQNPNKLFDECRECGKQMKSVPCPSPEIRWSELS